MRRALRWLAPSAACACAGAIAAGIVEGADLGPIGCASAVGFLALFALPVFVVASALVRGAWAAWDVRSLVAVEDGGAAPVLAAWLLVALSSAAALAGAMYQATWLLAKHTEWKANVVALAEPVAALAAFALIAALSRPCVRLFAHGLRKLDAKWRARGRRSLLSPRRVIATAVIVPLVGGYAAWRFVVLARLGPLDTSALDAPLAGILACGAAHAAWARWPRVRVPGGAALGGLAILALALGAETILAAPDRALAIWGECPLAGLALETVIQVEDLRDRMPMAAIRPEARPGAAHPDIVLITIDTVRADHTPPYGGAADMPVLKKLAASGTVFRWAFGPSNVTRRSLPSLETGLYATRVHGRVQNWALKIDPRYVTIAERLRAGGYETAGFMCCDSFWGPDSHTGLARGLEHVEIDRHGISLARKAIAWLNGREQRGEQRPLFVWVHLIEPHEWTTASGPEPKDPGDRIHMYDRMLRLADDAVGQILTGFSQAPIVIISADHGEALGEHGQPYHSTDLYNSQLRIPLVMAGPGIKAQAVGETVSLTDVGPTILDLAGFVPPAELDGRTLAPLATGAAKSDDNGGVAFAAMIKDRSNDGGQVAVIRGRWKLLDRGGKQELYDIHADPGEHQNVLMAHPAEAEQLRQLLHEKLARSNVSPF
ncbi:MAG TPA: sulfatase [Kofleriaceae bacterium]|jgi:arylsulfatase A-like enzyme